MPPILCQYTDRMYAVTKIFVMYRTSSGSMGPVARLDQNGIRHRLDCGRATAMKLAMPDSLVDLHHLPGALAGGTTIQEELRWNYVVSGPSSRRALISRLL